MKVLSKYTTVKPTEQVFAMSLVCRYVQTELECFIVCVYTLCLKKSSHLYTLCNFVKS